MAPDHDRCAPRPTEEPETDSLLERWLARTRSTSQQRLRVAPAPSAPPQPPIGDDLADAWFR
jgi:hypothetical protein